MVSRSADQDAFMARLKAQLAPAMLKLGQNLQRRIERSIKPASAGDQREGSAPGQPPADQSGAFRSSFSTKVETFPEAVVVTISSSDPAALHLELGTQHARPRPSMRPALAAVRRQLAGQLASQLRRRI